MKSLINLRAGALMLMLIFLSGTSAWADVEDYLLSVRNVSHTTNTIDFDLYLLDTDNTQTFEFASLQMGLLLNSSIYGSGILTVSYSNTGSGLDGDQQFVFAPDVVAPLAGYTGKTLIRLMPNSIPPVPPGAGSGTVISAVGNGTLLAHFTITSSVSFTPNTRAGMEFCAGAAVSPLFPTVVYSYIEGNSTALPVTPGIDAIVDGDPILNATPPALFNVTGTGDYCQGGAGLPVGLSGSELNTTYTLYRDAVVVTTIPGTGSTITFGNRTEGTYTVFAINAASTVQMTGQAVITAVVNTAGTASSTPTLCINTPLTAITHTTSGATGIGAPVNLPGGVTASWAANTVTITGTPSVAGVFGYSIPLTGGCGTVSATGTITVTASPVTSAITGDETPACSASGIQYSVTPTAGSTYTWSVPENAAIATGQGTNSIIVNFGTTNGTIIVTERSAAGCYGTPQTLAISLQGCGLDANFSGTPEEICIGGSVEFTNTSTGITGATTFLWNFGSGATPATANEIGPHTVTYSITGLKTVSLTITEGASNSETKVDFITVYANNTVTPPSATPTLCISTPLTAITHTTSGATGIGAPGNLPGGVTASWAANTVTISGTPTVAGTFNYTIPLTGGCGIVNATGTITVNAIPGAAGLVSGSPSFTPGTSGIPYSVVPITAASSYIWSYSGTGVTIIGTGPSVTLNFSVSATPGTLSVFGRNICGDGSGSTLDLSASTKTLTLTSVLLEGLYNGGGIMREVSNGYAPQYPGIADLITIELHDAASYSTIIYSVPNVNLSLNGTATATIPAAFSGSYYITVKHRNSLETTTSTPVSFSGTTINRSFATRTNVFGENLKSSGDGFYLIFGADVNQDGIVDTGDMNDVDNGSAAILIGYNLPDANGDGLVDTSDMNIVDNNSAAVVFIRIPF